MFGGSTSMFGGGAPSGGTSLFGQARQPQQQQQQSQGLFGAAPSAAGTSLFGAPPPAAQQQPFGLDPLGKGQQQFRPMTTSFGQPQQQQQLGGGGSMFDAAGGAGRSNIWGQAPAQPSQAYGPEPDYQAQAVIQASQQAPWWYRDLVLTQSAYRPGQYSKFNTMLYEPIHVPPGPNAAELVEAFKMARKRQLLQRTPWIDMREWQRFEERNPDPSRAMPVPSSGVEALHARVSQQASVVREQLALFEGEDAMGGKNWLASAQSEIRRLDEAVDKCRLEQERLSRRIVGVLGRLERLQARSPSASRMKGEVEFADRLVALKRRVEDPKGCAARLTEIEAKQRLFDLTAVDPSASNTALVPQQADPLAQAPESDPAQQAVLALLDAERQELERLVALLRRDTSDIAMIQSRMSSSSA